MTPPRKAPRLDGHEDIEQDFDQALAPEPVKKAPKSSGKDKKLNRERVRPFGARWTMERPFAVVY